MKKVSVLFLAGLFAFSVATAHAQGGGEGSGPCDSSPENPTLVLAAIGSAGAGLAGLRMRLQTRKAKK